MPPPQLDSPSPGGRRLRSILTIAMVVIASVGAGVLLILPTGFIGTVFVFGGVLFSAVIGFHYLVWGCWLSRILREEARDESEGQ